MGTQVLMRTMNSGVYLLFLFCLLQVVEKLEASGRLNTAVSKEPSTAQLELGSNVSLKCNFESFRRERRSFSVRWYKDGAPLRRGSGGVYYNITSVNVTDQGYYQCVARIPKRNTKRKRRAKFVGTTIKLTGFFTTYMQFTVEVTDKLVSPREVNDKVELKVKTYLEERSKTKVTIVAKTSKIRQKRYRGRKTRRFARGQLVVYENYHENNATIPDARKYFVQLLRHLRKSTRFRKLEGLSVLQRSVRFKSLGYCLPSITGKRHLKGKFKLPITAAGKSANVSCPYGPRDAHAQSMCVESALGARWKFFNDDKCNFKSMMTRAFRRLAKEKINKRNARRLAREAKNVTKSAPPKEINEADVNFLQSIIKGVVDVGELDSNGQDVVDIIDTILNANETVFKESQKLNETAKRFIELVDAIAANFSTPGNGLARQLLAPNLIIQAQTVDPSNFPGYRLSVASGSKANRKFTENKISMEDLPAEKIETGVTLPKDIFQNAGQNAKGSLKIAVTIYQNAKFFQTVSANKQVDDADVDAEVDEDEINVADDDTYNEFKNVVDDDDPNDDSEVEETEGEEISQEWSVSSRVISSSIVGVPIKNLTDPVELIFDPLVPKGKFPVCVFWDFEANGGHGNWSTEGCRYATTSSGRITCHCNHMTNFAVLFTAHGAQSLKVDESHALALSVISYIGCAISLLGVLLTVITYAIFRSLRKSHAQYILISFCVSLALLLIVFMAGATRVGGNPGCSAVAALLHYLVLAVVMWMGVEGYQMYLAFVKILATYQTHFMLKVSAVAWGVPAIIVVITAAVATSSYGNEQYCVLSGVAFQAALFAPSLLILAANFAIFIYVLWRLSHSHDASSADKRGTILQRCRTGLAVMVLLGLTWMFGAFAIRDAKLVFEYLFCIFNSLQGFFIFVFYCAMRPEVRKKWRGVFRGNEMEYLDSTKSTGTKTRSIRTSSNCAQMV